MWLDNGRVRLTAHKEYHYILTIGTKRPILKDLYKYFIPLYAAQWEDIGVNLDIDLGHLEIIKVDNPNNVRRRCQILLQSWLRVDPDATWDKLFTAIDDCASSISAGTYLTCYCIATWDRIK